MPRPPASSLVSAADADRSPVLDAQRQPLLDLLESFVRTANDNSARRQLMATVGFPSSDVPTFLAVNQLTLHGALRPTELAERLETGRPNLTKIVQRLEGLGLVVRTADPVDERGVLVALTGEGRRIGERVLHAEQNWIAEVLSGWEDDEVAELTALMRKFVDNVVPNTGQAGPQGNSDADR